MELPEDSSGAMCYECGIPHWVEEKDIKCEMDVEVGEHWQYFEAGVRKIYFLKDE